VPALILIVDDDESARLLLQIILEREGYQVQKARSGEDALAMIAENPPALILLDDVLPGIWGDEVHEKLKRNPATAAIKVVMHTGRNDKLAQYRQRSDIAGVLPKPTHPNEVLKVIKACLEG
jgi:CheY-like chemotaxis protein